MRLLFVKLKHIGDALILTPALQAAREKYPHAQIWVVVRKGTEGILKGCTAIDRICTTSAPESHRRGRLEWFAAFRLVWLLRRQRFDYAFELGDGDRGRGIVALSGARRRCANERVTKFPTIWKRRFNQFSAFDWQMRHQVEKDFRTVHDILPLSEKPGPLVFEPDPKVGLPAGLDGDYLVIHPATRWQRKRWPLENWVRLCRELAPDFRQIVVSCGPDTAERDMAASICREVGSNLVSTEGKLSWTQLATVLRGAAIFIGVDTAAMHLAAACGTPTVALFGPSNEFQWSPWKVPHRIVLPREPVLDPLHPAFLGWLEQRKTAAIHPEDVIISARDLLSTQTGKVPA